MRSRRSLQILLAATVLATTAARCSPEWAEDAARALKTTEDDAIRIVRRAAEETAQAEDDVARYVVANGADVVQTRPRLVGYLGELEARLQQSDSFWQDVIYDVYCSASVRARSGQAVTPVDVYDSAVSSFGTEVADALWDAGWVDEVVALIDAARSEDPQAMQLVVAEFLYCSRH